MNLFQRVDFQKKRLWWLVILAPTLSAHLYLLAISAPIFKDLKGCVIMGLSYLSMVGAFSYIFGARFLFQRFWQWYVPINFIIQNYDYIEVVLSRGSLSVFREGLGIMHVIAFILDFGMFICLWMYAYEAKGIWNDTFGDKKENI